MDEKFGRFTREELFEFCESACDLCGTEKFVIVCNCKEHKNVKIIAENRDEVFHVCSMRMIYGWDFAIFPW